MQLDFQYNGFYDIFTKNLSLYPNFQIWVDPGVGTDSAIKTNRENAFGNGCHLI